MTQTMKNSNTPPTGKKGRPGQRQQERQMRIQRRRRRLLIISTIAAAVLLVVIAIAGLVLYQKQQSDIVLANNAHATATSTAQVGQATATAIGLNVQATAIVNDLKKQYSSGPNTPPPVSQTPKKLADGLQYIVLKEGNGPAAKAGMTASTEYTGWVESTGKKFDSSYDRGAEPLSFPLGQNQVIKGWEEGITGMKVGETRRVIIPASLAYGPQEQKDQSGKVIIPANSTLIFDVTLVNVQVTPPQQQQQQQQQPQQ